MYLIGVDGGGTRSTLVVTDMDGNLVYETLGGKLNYNGSGKQEIDKNYLMLFEEVKKRGYDKECKGICIGSAGISNASVKENIMELLRWFRYPKEKAVIVGDGIIGLYGAVGKENGGIIISGTGSIALGKREGKIKRVGGYGHVVDDLGSGYYIGQQILAYVVRSIDGRERSTLLKDSVFKMLGLQTIEDLIGFVHRETTTKKEIAQLSVLIEEAIDFGDDIGLRIADDAVGHLFDLVNTIIKFCGNDCCLSCSGSVLIKNKYINEKFINLVKSRYPYVSIIEPKNTAAYGGIVYLQEVMNW